MIVCIVLFSILFIGSIVKLFLPIDTYGQYDALIYYIENKITKALAIIISMSLLFIILFSTLLGKIIIPKIKKMIVLKNKEEEFYQIMVKLKDNEKNILKIREKYLYLLEYHKKNSFFLNKIWSI